VAAVAGVASIASKGLGAISMSRSDGVIDKKKKGGDVLSEFASTFKVKYKRSLTVLYWTATTHEQCRETHKVNQRAPSVRTQGKLYRVLKRKKLK